MIYSLWTFCLLTILTRSESLDCENQGTAKTTTMMRLKLHLLCDYDRDIRPVTHHSNRTIVSLLVAPRIINFDDTRSIFKVKTWISMNWKDQLLTWDKLEYDGIDQIIMQTSMLWVPDLSVYNSNKDLSLDQELAPVMVDFRGEVYSFLSPEISGHCLPNWANWPFDIHVCTITLGSKRYLGSTVDFRFFNHMKGLMMKYILPSKDWEILAINNSRSQIELASKNDTNKLFTVTLNFDFTLRRHASVYIASYLIPGVVMVILSLGVLWIPSVQVERIAILCTLVIIQSLYLQYIAYKIPSNGDTTPYLVCFYRDCIFLTGLLVVETIVTRSMLTWNSKPSYLQTTFQFVTSNKVLQYIFVNDIDPKSAAQLLESGNEEGSTLVTTDDGARQWQMFVKIINKTCFILLVPIYLLLSVSLLPINYSFSPN